MKAGDAATITEDCESLLSSKQEFEKKNSCNNSLLNIAVIVFKGCGFAIDIHLFQSKLYLKSVPTSMLLNLLKNNFLEDSALSLVKSADGMQEIWKRLKGAYGDTKTVLKN